MLCRVRLAVCLDMAAQGGNGIGLRPGQPMHGRVEPLAPPLQHGVDETVLRAEAVLHAPLGDPGFAGDRVDCQSGRAGALNDGFRGVENLVPVDRSGSAGHVASLFPYARIYIAAYPIAIHGGARA